MALFDNSLAMGLDVFSMRILLFYTIVIILSFIGPLFCFWYRLSLSSVISVTGLFAMLCVLYLGGQWCCSSIQPVVLYLLMTCYGVFPKLYCINSSHCCLAILISQISLIFIFLRFCLITGRFHLVWNRQRPHVVGNF